METHDPSSGKIYFNMMIIVIGGCAVCCVCVSGESANATLTLMEIWAVNSNLRHTLAY